jgi:signal transduction histidine kinase
LLLQLRSNPHASLQFEESERPPLDQRTFWLDGEPLSLLATGGVVSAGGFALQQAVPVHVSLPAVPERLRAEFSPRALLSVPFAVGGEWRGRLFLLDTESGSFSREQLADLQQLLVGLTPVLSNLLAVRTLMTQALDNERDRVVRELHDSVAQTLASIEMQLAVYRRLATQDPARTSAELERLQRTVKQEKEEFRRFLRALKPVRVSPQELVQWILAHSAQFQQETGIQVEVVAGPVDSRLPEGVCREVFLIFREALHNVQKHARAREVRVQLRQDENYLRLLVDDDGCGFPFSGTYSQNALEETGNAPLSICERTRSLGGMLSIDSAPGSGATLRVDIPLR